jgi:hypothetical protein
VNTALRAVAGPFAALLCAWLLCPIPTRKPLPMPALLAAGLGYICLVALTAILTGQLARAPFPALVKSATAALWCAPLVVLAVQGSPLTVVPLIALVVLATPLFGLDRRGIAPSHDSRLLRQFPSSMIAAAAIQLAAVEALLHHQEVAGILLSAGAAVIAWRATAVDPRARSRPARVAAMAAIVVALVLFGMLPFQAVPGTTAVAGTGHADSAERQAGDGGVMADSYRGVILLPEIQHKVTLVPPLPALIDNPFRENKKDLEIPFYGVYWFFRRPYTHPPQDSLEMHGKPSELTFRSHDSRELIMEAHQSLGAPFNVSCCGSIQLAITNRNRASGSVSIELLLVNTFSDEKPSQTLGMRLVQSVFGANEVLDYPIPPSPAIRQFDEFTIRFHRPIMLARESPNVSIDGFTLKPR